MEEAMRHTISQQRVIEQYNVHTNRGKPRGRFADLRGMMFAIPANQYTADALSDNQKQLARMRAIFEGIADGARG